MMKRGQSLFAAVALLLGCIPFAASAQEQSGVLRVSGGLERGSSRTVFRLEVSHEAGTSPAEGQSLLVYAEPSHSLLLANVDPAIRGLEDHREALALMRGSSEAFRHSVTLPYRPFTDRRIVVVLRGAGGQEWVVADALVNLRKFDFSTSVAADGEIGQPTTAARIYNHCCRGGRCENMCVECHTPEFTCDLINCDIQCGHDSTWPPKV